MKLSKALEAAMGGLISGEGDKPYATTRMGEQKTISHSTTQGRQQQLYIYKGLAAEVKGRHMEPLLVKLIESHQKETSQHDGEDSKRQYDHVYPRHKQGARLNFAESLLRFRDGQTGIIFCRKSRHLPYAQDDPDLSKIPCSIRFHDFKVTHPLPLEFEQLPFDHPLYIMYSSGTTGLPKCMVQSAGGILLQQIKEHLLHTDLKREDTIFYFTTCGWMMWNWLTCALSVGATLVLYDGNPFHPGPDILWKMAEAESITVFGTSAGYLSALSGTGLKPGEQFDLSALRALLSTGSHLSIERLEYVYRDIKKDLQLASISGGTDINGCFALGDPIGQVYAGELQCRGLGMKVEAYDSVGQPLIGEQGELVCTAEIYRQVEILPQIEDALVVGQNWKNDVRVILFVKLVNGHQLNDDICNQIRQTIRTHASPRHVPAKIITVPDIPYTLNMKKVEIAVKKPSKAKPCRTKTR